ncbi:hypothetical protein Isop_2553 [Isosphaera pallida ATCC 43644]|uniref:Uncharacterized protein n=1 Tax=Isosphaera pallida (strain ATCC 43644 / DSM 9630 / IS1B) TaxID=575540 RepID=E8QYC9_ISOPI|nr:hypothetical protein Isop_2553 [Isosphaera pallida ATCC 43644]
MSRSSFPKSVQGDQSNQPISPELETIHDDTTLTHFRADVYSAR